MKTEQHLEGAFGKRAPVHYDWQTEHPVVGARERDLCRRAFEPLGQRLLDLGCAEGATLHHLGEPAGATGVDIFEDKLVFARQRLPKCKFVCASGYELPFEDATFDHVIVRDVIHHMDEPHRAVDEMARVLAPGGRVDVLEPCGRNPLIFLHALTNKAERGELRSTPRYLSDLVARRFSDVVVERFQALPLHRIVYHPSMGSPALGARPGVERIVDGLEGLSALLLPRALWAYIHVRATKR